MSVSGRNIGKLLAIGIGVLLLIIALFFLVSFADAADYPSTQVDVSSIVCPPALAGDCIDLGGNSTFLVSHNANGTEKASHFDAIPGPMLPSGTQNIGASGNPWAIGYINLVVTPEIRGTTGTNLKIQGTPTGNVTVFEDDPSGQNYFDVYGPGCSAYTRLYHDCSNGFIESSVGSLNLNTAGGDVQLFESDASGQNYLKVFAPASADYLRLSHDGTDGVITQSGGAGAIRFDDDIVFTSDGTLFSRTGTILVDDVRAPAVPFSIADAGTTWDTAWSANITSDKQAVFNAINYLADNISGAATLQGAYDNGNSVTTTPSRNFNIVLDANDTYVTINNTGSNVSNPLDNGIKITGKDYLTQASEYATLFYRGLNSGVGSFFIKNNSGAITLISTTSVSISGGNGNMTVDDDSVNVTFATGTGRLDFMSPSVEDSAYEVEISTPSSADLLINSSGKTKVMATSNTLIDSGTSTILSAAGATKSTVYVGQVTDRDDLYLYGVLAVNTNSNGGRGTGAFSSGTTVSISNTSVTASSSVYVQAKTQPSGMWWVTTTTGSFTVHSTATEATTQFNWLLVN